MINAKLVDGEHVPKEVGLSRGKSKNWSKKTFFWSLSSRTVGKFSRLTVIKMLNKLI